MVLINIVPEGSMMRLVYSGGEVLTDRFYPYFYVVSDNADEKKHLIEQHPNVVNCEIEEKFPTIKSRETEPVVKVTTTMGTFRKVIRDLEKVEGIVEIAESTIPHYYRYAMDRKLRFFEGDDDLDVKAVGPGDDIPKCDVLVTFGGDEFLKGRRGVKSSRLGCFLDSVHIDIKVDMKYDIYNEGVPDDLLEAGKRRLTRVMELSRMSNVRPDLVSRITPGKLNTFLHMKSAREKGYLVPDIKKELERPKSLRMLQAMDKGGTIFYPRPGIYRNVAKCDFASMYPNIIVKYNITPEKMHCGCGDDHIVPEAGWRICNKRGIISDGIEAVLKRRLYLKRKKRETGLLEYDIRQKALKNILVTCFDGGTIIPHICNGELKLERIKDIIEPLAMGKTGHIAIKEDLKLFGLDNEFNAIQNPVKAVVRIPSKKMFRVKADWGREVRATEDHLWYVLEKGALRVKRTRELKEGDYLPIMSKIKFNPKKTEIDIMSELLRKLPPTELETWRVFGLKEEIGNQFERIKIEAGKKYTYRTLLNWRECGYIPMKYLHCLNLENNKTSLYIGRGRQTGGIIKKIPATIRIDNGLGFFLGFFAGDGSYGRNMMRLDVGGNAGELITKLKEILKQKFNLEIQVKKEKKANMYVVQINSVALNRIFELVFGLGSSSKKGKLRVSEFLLNSNQDFLYGYISGLIASDRYLSKKRNFANIASHRLSFIRKLGFLFSMLGLEYRINRNGEALYEIQLRGLGELNLMRERGWVKSNHRKLIEKKKNELNSYRNPQFPVFESGFFEICRKTRTPPWQGQRERISRAMALEQLGRIDASKLDSEGCSRLNYLKKLASSDVVFAKIKTIVEEDNPSGFAYCFEVENGMPGFVCEGQIFTHNCFGYLGFKNFVFSNVETKECVMLYGRHIMERTKEIADSMGLEVVYGIVDSVFVRSGTTDEYQEFVKKVTDEFGIELELDCIFESIAFPASSGAGVANKYYGITGKGEIEARGIALRHSDAPQFIREFQEKAVRAVFGNGNIDEIYNDYQNALVERRFSLEQLAITKSIRQASYKVNAAHVVAYRKNPVGSTVTYVHTHYGPVPLKFAKDGHVNVKEYLRLLKMKRDELLEGLVIKE